VYNYIIDDKGDDEMVIENYKDLSDEQVREIASRSCERNGFELIDIKSLDHVGDDYLRYVLAHKEGMEYATWLLNLSVVGLHYGHYFTYYSSQYTPEEMYEHALQDFKNRD
jgi:hypothetical protein